MGDLNVVCSVTNCTLRVQKKLYNIQNTRNDISGKSLTFIKQKL